MACFTCRTSCVSTYRTWAIIAVRFVASGSVPVSCYEREMRFALLFADPARVWMLVGFGPTISTSPIAFFFRCVWSVLVRDGLFLFLAWPASAFRVMAHSARFAVCVSTYGAWAIVTPCYISSRGVFVIYYKLELWTTLFLTDITRLAKFPAYPTLPILPFYEVVRSFVQRKRGAPVPATDRAATIGLSALFTHRATFIRAWWAGTKTTKNFIRT